MNIALTGKFRAGKDVVAAYLVEHYGYTRFAFGDELKRYAHELFDVDPANKPRELYQTFGQWCRGRDPEIWVRKCFDKITFRREDHDAAQQGFIRFSSGRVSPGPFRAVISDLRQPNEFDRCRAEGYVIIRVNCPDEIRLERARAAGDLFTAESLAHETESYVDSFAADYDVVNDGTLTELYSKIDAIMAQILPVDPARRIPTV